MANSRGLQGIAILLVVPLCVAASCTSPPTDGGGSGGSSASGGSGGTATGGAASGGESAIGGMGGSETCLQFDPDGLDCGTCELSVEEYCAEFDCSMPEELACTGAIFSRTYERGCGYLREEGAGDVTDRWARVWVEGTGELVYHYHNGRASSGCTPETTVGEEPECDSYEDACDSGLGGWGAGGMGGGP